MTELRRAIIDQGRSIARLHAARAEFPTLSSFLAFIDARDGVAGALAAFDVIDAGRGEALADLRAKVGLPAQALRARRPRANTPAPSSRSQPIVRDFVHDPEAADDLLPDAPSTPSRAQLRERYGVSQAPGVQPSLGLAWNAGYLLGRLATLLFGPERAE